MYATSSKQPLTNGQELDISNMIIPLLIAGEVNIVDIIAIPLLLAILSWLFNICGRTAYI